jgi:hypothetical protein
MSAVNTAIKGEVMSIYQQHRPGGTDDLYIKLLDGDKIRGRVSSEPAISVYKEGQKPRYSWIIFVRDKNGKEVNKPQILTKGISVYNGIADLVEEWGEPTSFDVAIKRTGSGLNDTEYSVTPVKTSSDLTKDQLEEVEKINLPKAIGGKWLEEYVRDGKLPSPKVEGEPMPTDDDAPINLDDLPF